MKTAEDKIKMGPVLEYEVIGTDFEKVTSDDRRYVEFLVRVKGDVFARPKKWNFFPANDEVFEALANDIPTKMYFAMVEVPTPQPYYSIWGANAPANAEPGAYVCTRDADGEWVPIVRHTITIMNRWVNLKQVSDESVEKMMARQWRAGINNGTIEPIEDDEPAADPLIGSSEPVDDEPPVDDKKPATNTPPKPGIR